MQRKYFVNFQTWDKLNFEILTNNRPVDTGHKLNVHKTFRRHPGRSMYVQFTSCDYGEGLPKVGCLLALNFKG